MPRSDFDEEGYCFEITIKKIGMTQEEIAAEIRLALEDYGKASFWRLQKMSIIGKCKIR